MFCRQSSQLYLRDNHVLQLKVVRYEHLVHQLKTKQARDGESRKEEQHMQTKNRFRKRKDSPLFVHMWD